MSLLKFSKKEWYVAGALVLVGSFILPFIDSYNVWWAIFIIMLFFLAIIFYNITGLQQELIGEAAKKHTERLLDSELLVEYRKFKWRISIAILIVIGIAIIWRYLFNARWTSLVRALSIVVIIVIIFYSKYIFEIKKRKLEK